MIYTILNVKGGVGKTMTAKCLAQGFAQAGKKTLVIDLDGQATLTSMLLPKSFGNNVIEELTTSFKGKADYSAMLEKAEQYLKSALQTSTEKTTMNTIVDALAQRNTIRECIYPTDTENLYICPSNVFLFIVEKEMLLQITGYQQTKLKNLLDEIKDEYDEIIIDNNPSLNMMSTNSLCACDQLIIPTTIDKGSLNGVGLTLNHCRDLFKNMRIKFGIKVLVTMTQRNKVDEIFTAAMENCMGTSTYKSKIRYQAAPVKKAGLSNEALINNNNANVAKDYRDFINEVIQEENKSC